MPLNPPNPPRAARPAAIEIAEATDAHVFEIARIYEHYVRTETCTFETQPPQPGEMLRRMGAVREHGLPWLVALDGPRVVGYAYATRYRERSAYRHTAENSVYLDPDCRGRGVGSRLLDALIARCTEAPYAQLVAIIGDSANAASIALHRKAGFRLVGTLQGVGFKFDRWLDTVLMQRSLDSPAEPPPLPDGGAARSGGS